MGMEILKDMLMSWGKYELDDAIYIPADVGEIQLGMEVDVLPFDPYRKRMFEGKEYFLGIEQLRDAIEGIEAQLGRTATAAERLRATIHYARYDAFIEPKDAIGDV